MEKEYLPESGSEKEPLEPEEERRQSLPSEGPAGSAKREPGNPSDGEPPAEGSGERPDRSSKGERPTNGKRGDEGRSGFVLTRWQFFWVLTVIAFVAVLLLVLWYGLQPPEQEPALSVQCEDQEPRGAYIPADGSPTTQFLVRREIILTGPSDSVDELVKELAAGRPDLAQIELEPVRTCKVGNLGRLARSPGLDPRYFPFPGGVSGELAMNLYQIVGEQTVGEVVREIQRLGENRGVFADANYLTGLLGQSQCGRPFEPVGSPFEPVGSPFEPVGSPFEPVGSPTGSITVATGLFWEQWAFEHIGMDPAFREMLPEAASIPDGAEVRVGVFDTSPFTLIEGHAGEEMEGVYQSMAVSVGDAVQASAVISWVTPTLPLRVAHPAMPPFTATISNPVEVKDHGLFVAGLVHAIAPESEVQLIRVLNEYGCGDLYTFNEALYRFVQEVEREQKKLDGVVMNLSLGVQRPTTGNLSESGSPEETEEISAMAQQEAPAGVSEAAVEEEGATLLVTDTVESLRAVVALAYSEGIVVVAAAGNDSWRDGKPWPPQLPAAYPFVIGAAASNIYRERACFSNWGDVYAPGGDAGSDVPGNRGCVVQADEPAGGDGSGGLDGLRDDALISLAWSFPSHYGYWKGTSFSTPLVSGLAALVLDEGVSEEGAARVRKVFEAIRCGAPAGDGVINGPATLLRCLP